VSVGRLTTVVLVDVGSTGTLFSVGVGEALGLLFEGSAVGFGVSVALGVERSLAGEDAGTLVGEAALIGRWPSLVGVLPTCTVAMTVAVALRAGSGVLVAATCARAVGVALAVLVDAGVTCRVGSPGVAVLVAVRVAVAVPAEGLATCPSCEGVAVDSSQARLCDCGTSSAALSCANISLSLDTAATMSALRGMYTAPAASRL
jgi:hypothetical protein